MAEVLALFLVIVLFILMVVAPLVARAFDHTPRKPFSPDAPAPWPLPRRRRPVVGGEAPLAPHKVLPPVVHDGFSAPPETVPEEFEEVIDLERIEGKVKASILKKVGTIIDDHPQEALSIISGWLNENGAGA